MKLLLWFGRFLFLCMVASGCWYASYLLQRPPRTALTRQLAEGMRYERQIAHSPHPLVWHLITLSRSADWQFRVTPPDRLTSQNHLDARTTGQFARQYRPKVAINAS